MLEVLWFVTLQHITHLVFIQGNGRVRFPEILPEHIVDQTPGDILGGFIPLRHFHLVIDTDQHHWHRVDDSGDVSLSLAQLFCCLLQHFSSLRHTLFQCRLDFLQRTIRFAGAQVGTNQENQHHQQNNN